MVLQRDQPITLWGLGPAFEQVKVRLFNLQNERVEFTTVDEQGNWRIMLPSLDAGGPYQLVVECGDQHIALYDVLIGEVWLASGQSNMEWKIGWKIDDLAATLDDSDYPQIRYADIQLSHSAYPLNECAHRGWVKASRETIGEFSAVAWFFAKYLHKNRQVPVGIIDATWGGTPAEAWTQAQTVAQLPYYRELALDLINNAEQWQRKIEANLAAESQKWPAIYNRQCQVLGCRLSADCAPISQQQVYLPNDQSAPLNDIVWLKKDIELTKIPAQVRMQLGDVQQVFKVFINGRYVYEKDWQQMTTAIDLDCEYFHLGLNHLVLRVANGWDNQVRVGTAEAFYLETDNQVIPLAGPWQFNNQVEPPIPQVKHYNWLPGVIYNGMIAPLTPLSLKGVLWYQGENNVDKAEHYGDLFKALIQQWRDDFAQRLPFLFVQISSFGKIPQTPGNSPWAQLREAQQQALQLADTGMAVSCDVGDQRDVHPRNKHAVGHRLWLQAATKVYGQLLQCDGPAVLSIEPCHSGQQSGWRVTFRHCAGGLVVKGDTLKGFELQDQYGNWVRAHARLEGETVFVWHEGSQTSHALRYAWADFSEGNLYNGDNLPAFPFRQMIRF